MFGICTVQQGAQSARSKVGKRESARDEIMAVAGAGSWGARETLVRTSALALCWLESH